MGGLSSAPVSLPLSPTLEPVARAEPRVPLVRRPVVRQAGGAAADALDLAAGSKSGGGGGGGGEEGGHSAMAPGVHRLGVMAVFEDIDAMSQSMPRMLELLQSRRLDALGSSISRRGSARELHNLNADTAGGMTPSFAASAYESVALRGGEPVHVLHVSLLRNPHAVEAASGGAYGDGGGGDGAGAGAAAAAAHRGSRGHAGSRDVPAELLDDDDEVELQVIETLTEALRAHRPRMAACGVRRVTVVLPHHRRGERRKKVCVGVWV